MSTQATRQADAVLAPRWSEIGIYATSGTAATANLNLIGVQTPTTIVGQRSVGAPGRYVRIACVTTAVWVVFADTSAHADDVAAGTAGVNLSSGGFPIAAGTYQDFICPTDYFWLGFITASSTGQIVVYISSPQ